MKRMTVEYGKEVSDRMEAVMGRLEIRTKTELFRKALAVLDLVSEEEAAGSQITLTRPDGSVRQLAVR